MFKGSLRGQAVLEILEQYFEEHKDLLDPHRRPGMLPLAVQQKPNEEIVHWTGADTILGPTLLAEWAATEYKFTENPKFQILAETLAQKLHYD